MVNFYLFIVVEAFICVSIIDKTDIVDSVTKFISGLLTGGKIKRPFKLKPFTCSLCMTFWIGLLGLLGWYDINIIRIGFIVFMSLATSVLGDLIDLGFNIINKLIRKIYERIN